MQISHKTQAALQFLVPTAVIYVAFGAFLLNGHWPGWAEFKDSSLAFALTGVAAMLVQDLVPKPLKEFLVFWRVKERLPGHRAFSQTAFNHAAIDVTSISDIENLKSCSAEEQQIAFYKIYDSVRDHSSVSHLSQRYVAWRDTTALLFLLFCLSFPVLATFNHPQSLKVGLILTGISAICMILTALAARNSANSLTIQVLSIPSPMEAPNGN